MCSRKIICYIVPDPHTGQVSSSSGLLSLTLGLQVSAETPNPSNPGNKERTTTELTAETALLLEPGHHPQKGHLDWVLLLWDIAHITAQLHTKKQL
jgi:hypothetical protein